MLEAKALLTINCIKHRGLIKYMQISAWNTAEKLKKPQTHYFINKAVWVHLTSTELHQNQPARCRNSITNEGCCSREPAVEISGSVHGVPSKTPRCFQPLEISAQRALLSGTLVIEPQICSGTQEATPAYHKLVWINAVLWTANSPDHFMEPHRGYLSCAGLVPTSTSCCLCGSSSPKKPTWILASCPWHGGQLQAFSWSERLEHNCSFAFEFSHQR